MYVVGATVFIVHAMVVTLSVLVVKVLVIMTTFGCQYSCQCGEYHIVNIALLLLLDCH